MRDPFHVLISSAGRRVALMNLFRRSLQALGQAGEVLAVDMTPVSSAFQNADRGFLVPRCTDPTFIPRMLDICRTEGVKLLVPTIDTELPAYAANRARFAEIGTSVLISDPETIAITGDKRKTHAWLTEHGLPTVRQASVEQVFEQGWPFPLLVKPVAGSSAIGVAIVHDRTALEAATSDGRTYVAQTIAQGNEYTVSLMVRADGSIPSAVPRRRLQVRAGEVSKGTVVHLEPVEALARKVASLLPGVRGAINVQIFHDPKTGDLNIIEVNPRFGGGFPLAFEAGARFPQWIIEDQLGLPSTATAAWTDRLVMLRYDDAIFIPGAEVGLGKEQSP